jgi:hypothetical protein
MPLETRKYWWSVNPKKIEIENEQKILENINAAKTEARNSCHAEPSRKIC